MPDTMSQASIPTLAPPDEFRGNPVVAAARCPVHLDSPRWQHVIVVKRTSPAGHQTFTVHRIMHDGRTWQEVPDSAAVTSPASGGRHGLGYRDALSWLTALVS